MLESIIRSNQQQSRAEQGQRTARLTPPKYRAVFGVAVSFLCHGFCKLTHIAVNAHPHFTALRCGVQSLQANTQHKNPRQKKLPEATLT
jgi:hypothetical protein